VSPSRLFGKAALELFRTIILNIQISQIYQTAEDVLLNPITANLFVCGFDIGL